MATKRKQVQVEGFYHVKLQPESSKKTLKWSQHNVNNMQRENSPTLWRNRKKPVQVKTKNYFLPFSKAAKKMNIKKNLSKLRSKSLKYEITNKRDLPT